MTAQVFPDDAQDREENDEGTVLEALARLPRGDRLRGRLRAGLRLSLHFTYREFYCKNGTRPLRGRKRTYRALCRQYLEPMRRKFGPCSVNSGYRTPSYNASVGGERGSFHVNDWHDRDDVAADVRFARGTPTEWAAEARRIRDRKRGGKGGIGVYPSRGFIHLDTRDFPANWTG